MKKIKEEEADPMDIFRDREGRFESGRGLGVHMSAMKPYVDYVLDRLVDDARIENGELLLPTEGRPVVVIASHGPGIAWVPLVALVGKVYRDHGCGDMIGGMFPHKAVFWVPGLKAKYERVLGTPTQISTVEDMTKLLEERRFAITGTAPEGANCLVSYDEYVAPFRSAGMVAAAIMSGASICLAAHKGAEKWNLRLDLPFGLKIPFTGGLKGVNIALPPYKRLERYVAMCRRYTPIADPEEMKAAGNRERRMLLHVEMERIRATLNLMTDEISLLMKKAEREERHRPASLHDMGPLDDPGEWADFSRRANLNRIGPMPRAYARRPWSPEEIGEKR